jgi:hypothetical protein
MGRGYRIVIQTKSRIAQDKWRTKVAIWMKSRIAKGEGRLPYGRVGV